VQAAVKIVFEPVFEADMAECSFGFRPKRSAHDALQVLIEEQARGRRWVVETDIANCFSAIPHDELMRAIEERVCDQSLLKLLRVILHAGVMEDGQIRREVTGTPQGGVISPVLCNVYLHRLDRAWDEADGVLARYADDAIVMCWSRGQAERALARLTELLAALGLEPKAAKTRIVHLEVGGEGLDFLGFHHRLVRSRGFNGKRPFVFLARWPSDRAMQHARDRIRDLTDGRRLLLRTEAITEEVNLFLRGWLFPVRAFCPALQQDQRFRVDASGAVPQPKTPAQPELRSGRAETLTRRSRLDQPVWNRRRAQGGQALAGETECRR
jgi:RNA-directed DNA polymerase